MRIQKYMLLGWLLILLVANSCSISSPLQKNSPQVTNRYASTVPFPTGPDVSGWQLAEQPVIEGNSLSVIIYAIELSAKNTTIISSTTSDKFDPENQKNLTIRLQDDIGEAQLRKNTFLTSMGNMDFWVMEFEPRNFGSREISLLVTENDNEAQYVKKFLTTAPYTEQEDYRTYIIRTILTQFPQTFEQDEFRILFGGWCPPPLPQFTPTRQATPGNMTHEEKAYLQIENINTGVRQYLYIHFLSNGEITHDLLR